MWSIAEVMDRHPDRPLSELRLEIERLQVFADAESAVFVHEHGRIVDANRAFCELIGCPPGDAVGLNIRHRIHSADRRGLTGLSKPDTHVTQHVEITGPDGRSTQLEGTGSPIVYRGRACRVVTLVDIGARLEAERAVGESERVMREMLESVPLLAVIQGLDGRILFCNEKLCEVAGYPHEQLIDQLWSERLSVGDAAENREHERLRLKGQKPPHEELVLLTRSGQRRLIAWSNTALRDRDGTVIGSTSIGEDVTARRRAELDAASRALQQDAVARLGVSGLRLGAAGLMQDAVMRLKSTLGVELTAVLLGDPGEDSLLLVAACGWPPEMVGCHCVSAKPGSLVHRIRESREPEIVADLRAAPAQPGRATIEQGVTSAMGVPIHGAGSEQHGVVIVHSIAPRVFSADDANFLQSVANVLAAAIERENAEQRVTHVAFHDQLTGLPNRAMLQQRLDEVIELAHRHDRAVALVWVDIDNLQLVNDSFGQKAGDDVIRQVALRLQAMSGGVDLVARYAGDEFLLVVADGGDDPGSEICLNVEDVAQIAQMIAGRVCRAFLAPFNARGSDVFLRPSIGVAMLPVHARDRDDLLRHADVAKDQVSAANRIGAATGNPLDPMREISLTARLHRALARNEFVLHYQPIVDITTGHLDAVEALVRWQDPEQGLVAPSEFIPLAERIGLIGPLTDWVVDEACRQARLWHSAGLAIGVAVNVPAILWHPAAAERLIKTVERHGIDPGLITVEVTESTAMTDPAVSDSVLERLSGAGLRLAIDDFGTGHSSLARLRQLPASTLKIDRSFVMELGDDPSADAMVETIIGLARNLGLEPLAEGIETEQQRAILIRLGCRIGQGFYFSRPRPAAEISAACALRAAA
jgi:diguanylate cyclase (GGDEF)-like protein/PAS domain S-box-containing protein